MDDFDIVAFAIGFAVHSVLYAFFIWVGLKIQKLEGKFSMILVAAMLASLAMEIPFAGKWIALLVVYAMVFKFSNGEFIDVQFAALIGWGGVFLTEIILISYLTIPGLGDDDDWEDLDEDGLTAEEQFLDDFDMSDDMDDTDVAEVAPEPAAPEAKSEPAPAAAKKPEPAPASAPLDIALKGVSGAGTSRPAALIAAGSKNYTVMKGDSRSIDLGSRSVRIKVVEIEESAVTLEVDGQATPVTLRMKSE